MCGICKEGIQCKDCHRFKELKSVKELIAEISPEDWKLAEEAAKVNGPGYQKMKELRKKKPRF